MRFTIPTYFPTILLRFVILAFFGIAASRLPAQTLDDVFTSFTTPSEITVFDDAKTFTVEYVNSSITPLSGQSIIIGLPDGINYEAGSLTNISGHNVQEVNVSNDASLSFSAGELPVGATLSFSIKYKADLDGRTYMLNGNTPRNTFDLTTNEGTLSDQSQAYNILYASLSITSISPTTTTVNPGQSTTRTISVVNGGYGRLSDLYLLDVYASGMTLNSIDVGTLSATADTLFLSGSDFSGIGNGDNYFDSFESIDIVETVTASGCTDMTVMSTVDIYWSEGAQVQNDDQSFVYLDIDIVNPNLNVSTTDSLNTCYASGEASQQTITLTNNGDGTAKNLIVDLFKSSGGGLDEDLFSRIDVSSITYQIGENGTPISITPSSTTATRSDGDYSCLGVSPIGSVELTLPDLDAGSEYVIKFDMYHCCVDACAANGIAGWGYTLNYDNSCANNPQSSDGTPQASMSAGINIFSETPADMFDGQKEDFTYTLTDHVNSYPLGEGAYYQVSFTIPVGLAWSGDSADIKWHSGKNDWELLGLDYNNGTKVLVAQYLLEAPFTLDQSEIILALSGDCSEAGATTGAISLELDIEFVADTSCATVCSMPLLCDEIISTNLHCPGDCDQGMRFTYFEVARTNFGSPDNDQNGLADASGSLDMDNVRENRVMVGDTFRTTFHGIVKTSGSYPSWSYGYARSDVEKGSYLSSVGASIKIYDASSGAYLTCDDVAVSSSLSGDDQVFDYDFSIGTLTSSCGSLSSYSYSDGDSVWLYTDYSVTTNPGGFVRENTIENDFYLSDIANPSSNSNKFQCGYFDGRYTLIGYYYAVSSEDYVTIDDCEKVISQSYYMSIGNCCDNYAGGDLFPYEYRNWSTMERAKVLIPADYDVIEIVFEQKRTKFVNGTSTESVIIPAADFSWNDTLFFDLSQYYTTEGGTINPSDDGFQGELKIKIAPTCDVPTGVYQDMPWAFTFLEQDILSGSETNWYNVDPDHVKFQPPSLKISSPAKKLDGIMRTVTWTLRVRNTSSTAGMRNAWLHLVEPGADLQILSVVDQNTGDTLSLTSDIYQIGAVSTSTTRKFLVTAAYTQCSPQDLHVDAGYECAGYPTQFAAFACPYSSYTLSVEPEESEMQMRINGSTIGDNCDGQVKVNLEILSAKKAHVDSVYVVFTLPSTGTITPASGELTFKYPLSANSTTLSDPAGNQFTIKSWEQNATLADYGLEGILDVNMNRIQIEAIFDLGSSYQPGESIMVSAYAQRPCGDVLPTINLIYDPSVKFSRGVNTGLESDLGNSWGASWADFDGDGDEDLLVPEYNHWDASHLYRNNGDGTFTSVSGGALTTETGSNVGSSWADYDNDGDLDVFMANNVRASNRIYRNDGTGNFDVPDVGELNDYNGYCHSPTWVDYDNDGHLDVFVAEYMPTRFNQLYQNAGNGTFSAAEGNPIILEATFSMGGAWGDYDNDGLVDVFIANCWENNNSLYHNDGNGRFTAVTTGPVVSDGGNSLGANWADFDNDGDLDLYVTNASNQANFFYENDGDGTFTKNTTSLIATEAGHSFGSSWFDVDNDGDLDVYVVNDNGNPNRLYMNNGGGNFTAPTDIYPNEDTENSAAIAVADYDNDGDMDMFVANNGNTPNTLYINDKGNCNAWKCFTLEGTVSNRSAIGAKVHVKANIYGQDVWQMREIMSQTGGISSQNTLKTYFGLGDATQIDSVIIEWPSGYREYMNNLSTNGCLSVTENLVSKISGTIFVDENGDCTLNAGEKGIPNVQLTISPINRQIVTDKNGYYEFYADTGSYVITQLGSDDYTPTCYTSVSTDVEKSGGSFVNPPSTDFPNSVSCSSNDLGLTLSSTALRKGFRNSYAISYFNDGAAAVYNSEMAITVDPEIIFLSATTPWDTIEDNGSTQTYVWKLDTVLAFSARTILVTDSVSASATVGASTTTIGTFRNLTGDCDLTDNTYNDLNTIAGAIDPNDLRVFPEGNVLPTDSITYRIRFQNVGSAPATHVIVRDPLSPYLDWSSIEVISASHDYEQSISEDGLLEFRFPYIMLVDSLRDEQGSHGWIDFKVLPQASVTDGLTITNQVSIQFDFENPLTTNTVKNVIDFGNANINHKTIRVQPNPMHESALIYLSEIDSYLAEGDIVRWELISALGQRLQTGTPSQNSVLLKRGNLTEGIYWVKVEAKSGRHYVSKLIVK
ncbi:MAG: FG-GAP-like repeat-containing protein [Bacteroidia bacterium]